MGRNIEIKARARDFSRQSRIAAELGDGPAKQLVQEDTFFDVPRGRLKLRSFADGSGELIQYERPDAVEPAESRYHLFPTTDPAGLKNLLAAALGVRAVVRKRRTVHLAGSTRIHLDQVEDLGDFLELEVVLGPGIDSVEGVERARTLMAALGIEEQDLVETAYVDLLEARAARSRGHSV